MTKHTDDNVYLAYHHISSDAVPGSYLEFYFLSPPKPSKYDNEKIFFVEILKGDQQECAIIREVLNLTFKERAYTGSFYWAINQALKKDFAKMLESCDNLPKKDATLHLDEIFKGYKNLRKFLKEPLIDAMRDILRQVRESS